MGKQFFVCHIDSVVVGSADHLNEFLGFVSLEHINPEINRPVSVIEL